MVRLFCCYSLTKNESALFYTCTGRDVTVGPVSVSCYNPCLESVEIVPAIQLQQNEQVLLKHTLRPEETEYKFGPCLVHLEDPWVEFGQKEAMKILDQDDFIVIRTVNGRKRRMDGAAVYQPVYGEEIVSQAQSIQVPVNHYLVIFDQNDTHMPEKHVRGYV